MSGKEMPLQGGNMSSGVVRIGDTVRRPAGPWTPAVHALLGYLHTVGFHGAPRPLGIDEHGREILTFIPGTVAWPGNFILLDPDDRLRRVARLIREFHDAVTGFRAPPDAQWQVLIPAEGTGIIAHHDLAPWNLIIGRQLWAFVDWDTAGPGSRLWDVAYAMHGFVPLSANHATSTAAPSTGCACSLTPTASPRRNDNNSSPCWPPRRHDARFPRPAGSQRHPAVDPAMARRPRRCLAS
ncbi:MAG TPA: aminoglycoside phosphotransferase family protein [Streptosporangiaceae bacterium]|nr:aminoglycoside phosphotransferase family protein [Streptosporangiaceae bacterium]